MAWTIEQKLTFLLRAPWTILRGTEDGEISLRVKELPSVMGLGLTDTDVERDFWGSLRAALEGYLQFNDPIPLAEEVDAWPWDAGAGFVMTFRIPTGPVGPALEEVNPSSAPSAAPPVEIAAA